MKRRVLQHSFRNQALEQLEQRVLFAAADLDVAFGVGGKVTTAFPGSRDDFPTAIAVSGGKTILAGTSFVDRGGSHSAQDVALARYNADGSLDASFGVGGADGNGLVLTDFGRNEAGTAVTVLASGKILVAGKSFQTTINGDTAFDIILVRYNADGTLDQTYGVGGADGNGKVTLNLGGDESANAMKVQSDGKILIAGDASGDFLLARFNSNGTLDTSFNGGAGYRKTNFTGYPDSATCLTILTGGKIVVGGIASNYPSSGTPTGADFGLARYNANGTLDTTFGLGTGKVRTNIVVGNGENGPYGLNDYLASILIRSDGRIIAVGGTSGEISPFSPYEALTLAKYTSAGVLESTVQRQDHGLGSDITRAVQLSSGKFLVAGGHGIARFTSDLKLDTTYGGGDGISARLGRPLDIALLSSDKVMAAGDVFFNTAGTTDFQVWRHNADGSLDTSFSPGGADGSGVKTTNFFDTSGAASASYVSAVAVRGDGRITAAGTFDLYGGGFARYNPDGTLDLSFGTGGLVYGLGGNIRSMAQLADGKTLALQITADGTAAELIRLNLNGSLDTTFGAGGSDGNGRTRIPFDARSGDMLLLGDGRIVVVGQSEQNFGDFNVARYNSNGTLDGNFGVGGLVKTEFGTLVASQANAVALAPGGKIVVAGASEGKLALARFNANGSLDDTFSPGGAEGDGRARLVLPTTLSDVRDLAVQASGKIDVLPAVYATSQAGFVLVQLTSIGAFDTTFGGGDGMVDPSFGDASNNDSVAGLLTLSNGQILVAGYSFNSGDDFGLARYNANGTPDATFGNGGSVTTDFGSTGGDAGYALAMGLDGRIVVAGVSERSFALAAYRGVVPSTTLRVDGTSGNDTIAFSQNDNTLTVTTNGVAQNVDATNLSHIFVYGLDGNDSITVDDSVLAVKILVGGRGQDLMNGGVGLIHFYGG
jgi:uncharacterized delta-60 repeat protein